MIVCNHKYSNGKSAIEYCSTYEMRSKDMYCKICGQEGTREELENKYRKGDSNEIKKESI